MKENKQSSISWLTGSIDSPELQKELTESKGYSIPTRLLCKATGEVEDIHIALADIVDDAQREKLIQAVKKVDSMTVGELSKMLSYARVGLILKEVEGEELTEQERTLRDLDITTLALYIVNGTAKAIGRGKATAPKGSE